MCSREMSLRLKVIRHIYSVLADVVIIVDGVIGLLTLGFYRPWLAMRFAAFDLRMEAQGRWPYPRRKAGDDSVRVVW